MTTRELPSNVDEMRAELARRRALGAKAAQDPLKLTTYLLLGCIALGLFLRIYRIDLPETFTFDEALFVKNAHRYLIGLPDDNDHPPLGKLLMALGHLAFDYNSLGWRFTSLCFGVVGVYIAWLLGQALFEDRRAGLFAAAFISADGFFIAYSRAGLLDGVLCCFILWTLLAAVTARNFKDVLLTGVLLGLSISIKWSAAFAVFPAALAIILLARLPWFWPLALGVSLPVHALIWMWALRITGRPDDLKSLLEVMVKLFHHHLDLGTHVNDLASKWYTWLWLYHPIVVKLSSVGSKSRYASSLGNPLLWALGTLSCIALPLYIGVRAAIARLKQRYGARLAKLPALPQLLDDRAVRATLVLATGWFALFSPWTVARGSYTFYYHYLPSYACALLLVAGWVAALERKRPNLVNSLIWVSTLVIVFFVPVWGEFPISKHTAFRRLMFKPWKP